jgi:hypothetical protein
MNPVSRAFQRFDDSLKLDPAEFAHAQQRYREVRQVLRGAGVVVDTFIQGSFGRGTMLRPLKDVDTVGLLASRHRELRHLPGGPAKALSLLRDAVEAEWPDATFDPDQPPAGKAVKVCFEDCSYSFDLVAAFDTDSAVVELADRDDDEWKSSTTRVLIRLIATRNQQCGGRFIHQVRMARSLKNRYSEFAVMEGIVFESLAYAAVLSQMSHQDAIARMLTHAADACIGPIYDPAHENDLTEKWTEQERRNIVRAFRMLSQRANEARALEADGQDEAAVSVWQSVFGSIPDEKAAVGMGIFPTAIIREPAEVMKSWAVGSLTGDGRPTSSTAGRHHMPAGRAWRQD